MKVTIYDVAKKAQVSIATVSNVINNKGRISEKTKKKVYEAMESLNYQPNIIASALMGKETKTVGLLIPDLANPFFSELARSIEDRGQELGYNLIICSTDYKTERERRYLTLLKQKQVDGFILASGFENLEPVEELINEEFPVSIVARDFPMFSVNAVAIDDFTGGYMAASHLIELGHKNIGVIALDLWSNRERVRGFKYALEEKGIQFRRDFQFIQDIQQHYIESGKAVTEKYIKSHDIPTAIFACNDLLAIGAIKGAKDYNLIVPKDISVIGFDNTSIATIVDPPLTTIAQPFERMGREVMDLIVSIIKGERNETIRLTIIPTLVERKSTKALG